MHSLLRPESMDLLVKKCKDFDIWWCQTTYYVGQSHWSCSYPRSPKNNIKVSLNSNHTKNIGFLWYSIWLLFCNQLHSMQQCDHGISRRLLATSSNRCLLCVAGYKAGQRVWQAWWSACSWSWLKSQHYKRTTNSTTWLTTVNPVRLKLDWKSCRFHVSMNYLCFY